MQNNNYEKIKEALISIGFKKEDAEKQIIDLGILIKSTIVAKMCMDHSDKKEQIAQDSETFLKENYTNDQINEISKEISSKIVQEYLDEITNGMDEIKKKDFYSKLDTNK